MYKNNKPGFALSITVIVLGSISIAMALTLVHASVSRLNTSQLGDQDTRARMVLIGCHDEVNAQLRRDTNFSPPTVSLGDATCTTSIIANGANRAVTLTYTVDTITKSLAYTISTTDFSITSWREY